MNRIVIAQNSRLNYGSRFIGTVEKVPIVPQAGGGDVRLDNRIKELIAVGASITANCQPCLHYHMSEAQKSGADEEDIMDAIEVGKMVRKGAAGKMDKFVAGLTQPGAPSDMRSSQEGGSCGV